MKTAEIYQDTDAVLAWPGEEDNSGLGMELIRRNEEMGGASESFSPHWSALNKIFARPYWTRVWVVQEIVFAREAILVAEDAEAAGIDSSLFLLS